MCNLQRMNVRSVSPNGVRSAYIPCGECLDCRLSQQFGWIARLRYAYEDLQKRYNGATVCMVTLTYRDSRLPHIPKMLVKDDLKDFYEQTPVCFNKLHIRSLVRKVRNWLYDVYGIKQPVYMICSEFGEHTQRPHYHGVFCVPKFVDCRYLHKLVKDFWCRHYGFICPNEFEGSREHKIKPFVAECPFKAVNYCAKYCCKDIAYHSRINRFHFERKHLKQGSEKNAVRVLDYLPFHFQSRSLGLSFLEGLTDSQKSTYLKRGCSFVGETKLHSLPKYYRDRILFDNDYKFVGGKRLCRRKPTEFFKAHYVEVYEQKREYIETIIKQWRTSSYWRSIRANDDDANKISALFTQFSQLSNRDLSGCYLAYFGKRVSRCYRNVSFEDQWFSRYFEDDLFNDYPVEYIDFNFYCDLSYLFNACHTLENSCMIPLKLEELRKEREKKKLREKLMGH